MIDNGPRWRERATIRYRPRGEPRVGFYCSPWEFINH
jgi:hypothetical protein